MASLLAAGAGCARPLNSETASGLLGKSAPSPLNKLSIRAQYPDRVAAVLDKVRAGFGPGCYLRRQFGRLEAWKAWPCRQPVSERPQISTAK